MHYQSNLQGNNFTLNDNLESEQKLNQFLAQSGISICKIEAIPFDASNRRYFRIFTSTGSYILMDSSLDLDSMKPFIDIDKYLVSIELHAPKILSVEKNNGYILLEDMGSNLFTKYIEKNPDSEYELYDSAIDTLLKLQSAEPMNGLLRYDASLLRKEIEVFLEWYVKYNVDEKLYKNCHKELVGIFDGLYHQIDKTREVVVLKDYMADNLLWLPERVDLDRVGILDFQDAKIGSPLYDLCSLLQDARRDVSEDLELHCLTRYLGTAPDEEFMERYNILSLQKNLRIVGVFNRLNLKHGKPKYLGYVPRVWKYINRNLANTANKEVRDWFKYYEIPQLP